MRLDCFSAAAVAHGHTALFAARVAAPTQAVVVTTEVSADVACIFAAILQPRYVTAINGNNQVVTIIPKSEYETVALSAPDIARVNIYCGLAGTGRPPSFLFAQTARAVGTLPTAAIDVGSNVTGVNVYAARVNAADLRWALGGPMGTLACSANVTVEHRAFSWHATKVGFPPWFPAHNNPLGPALLRSQRPQDRLRLAAPKA